MWLTLRTPFILKWKNICEVSFKFALCSCEPARLFIRGPCPLTVQTNNVSLPTWLADYGSSAELLSVASSHRPINYHHCAQISGGAATWWPWRDLCRPLSGSSRAAIQSVVKSCQTGSLEAVCGCVALAGKGQRWIDFFFFFCKFVSCMQDKQSSVWD